MKITVELDFWTDPRPSDPERFAANVVNGMILDNIGREWYDRDDALGYAFNGLRITKVEA